MLDSLPLLSILIWMPIIGGLILLFLKSVSEKYIRFFLNGQDNIQFETPQDPENGEYMEIQRQVKEGTLTIKDAD